MLNAKEQFKSIEDGIITFALADLAYLEVALHLFFSDGAVPEISALMLGKMEVTAAEGFQECVNCNLQRLPSSSKEDLDEECPFILQPKIASLNLQNSLQVPAISDSRCYNTGCQQAAKNTCTRCRKARYCSKECQIKIGQQNIKQNVNQLIRKS